MNIVSKQLKLIRSPLELRKPCQEVSKQEGLRIGKELFKFLRNWNREHKQGIGLSAIQVGIPVKVCVVLLPKLEVVLVNPVILEKSPVTIQSTEGCLSLPGVKKVVPRSICVTIATSNLGEQVFGVDTSRVSGRKYEDLLIEACCVQHEVDHTLSKLIIDY